MSWLDKYFFEPNLWQKILAFLLLPLSAVYALIAICNTKLRKKVAFTVPIISVGNLTLGGNGKTPICKAIAKLFADKKAVFIVLRGYKRKSKGLVIVKNKGEILCDVAQSGDEAMEYALDDAIMGVIVSENRIKGIECALNLGASLIVLDDAFSKNHIEKFDIILESRLQPYFNFTLPSGAYRLPKCFAKKADFIAVEGKDFTRHSHSKENQKAILITAIAKPFRLYEHFIKARACYFYKDHYEFQKNELEALLKKHHCDTLMLTLKDFVKVKDMGFKCQIIELDIKLSDGFKQAILRYVERF